MFALSPLHHHPRHDPQPHTRRDQQELLVLFFFLSFFFLIVHTASNGYLIFLNCRPQSFRRVFNLYLVCFVFAALAIIDHRSGLRPNDRRTAADAVRFELGSKYVSINHYIPAWILHIGTTRACKIYTVL